MPTYMTLINYTQKGIEKMKESPKRLDTAKEIFKSMGAEIKAYYLALGRYDAVVIAEGPDDETAAKLHIIQEGPCLRQVPILDIFVLEKFRFNEPKQILVDRHCGRFLF